MGTLLLWVAFSFLVLFMLALDLGVFHRRAHAVGLREAAVWSVVWVAVSLSFNLGLWAWYGSQQALEFLAGYLIEKSFSVDNIFVFAVLFRYFDVEARYQHRVLFWGILGALAMRGVMIGTGAALISRFEWILYLFGAFLVVSGVRMMFYRPERFLPEQNPVLRLARLVLPITEDYEGQKFFVRRQGLRATPLFLVLLVIETTDLAFAVDSIPAIFVITQDPFIVYTSNVFAILGLRALYFALAGLMTYFHHLHYGLAAILIFVGAKMLAAHFTEIPTTLALGVIAGILTLSIVTSILFKPKEKA